MGNKLHENKNWVNNIALRISIIYFLISSLWILISDRLILIRFFDEGNLTRIQNIKGMLFVLGTTLLIYVLVYRNMRKIKSLNKEYERVLCYFNYTDIITGLPNKLYFEKNYQDIKLRRNNEACTFLCVNIDNFTHINNLLGFDYGDRLLQELGNRLKDSLNGKGIISRIGGDEFVVILEGVSTEKEVDLVIDDILESILNPFEFEGEKFFITSTIGIAMDPKDGTTFKSLMKKSHIAMEYGKSNTKSGHIYYNTKMDEAVASGVSLLSEIRKGLTNKEFQLHYQIIKDIECDKIYAVESLIRWYHPKKGYIPPLEYIPIAENTDLIFDIRRFVVDESFRQKKVWKDKGIDIPIVGINMSLKSFCCFNLVEDIERKMKEYSLEKEEVVFELTESGFIREGENLMFNIEKLKNIGVKIALDDFGAGYSSLIRFMELPVDFIKIDKVFIDSIICNKYIEEMVASIIKVSDAMGITAVAEGIEEKEQLDKLSELGCRLGQGYYIGKPMPAEKIEELLAENKG